MVDSVRKQAYVFLHFVTDVRPDRAGNLLLPAGFSQPGQATRSIRYDIGFEPVTPNAPWDCGQMNWHTSGYLLALDLALQ